jgi:EpsI family protein
MRSTTIRLIALSFTVLVVYFIAQQLRGTLTPAYAALPDWRLSELPLQFGPWRGTEAELDEELTKAIDADDVTERLYENNRGDVVYAHAASFLRYSFGVTHNPYVCYRGAGWEVEEDRNLTLQFADDVTLDVPLVVWRRGGDRVMTLYWYQLGDQYLLDRPGLAIARLHFLGQQTWPPLSKVLLQTTATSPIEDEENLKSVAEHIGRWLGGRIAEPSEP